MTFSCPLDHSYKWLNIYTFPELQIKDKIIWNLQIIDKLMIIWVNSMFWLPQKLVRESKNSKQTRFHNRRLQQPNVLFMSSFVSVLFMCLLLENGVCTEKSIVLYCPIKIVFFITSSVFWSYFGTLAVRFLFQQTASKSLTHSSWHSKSNSQLMKH